MIKTAYEPPGRFFNAIANDLSFCPERHSEPEYRGMVAAPATQWRDPDTAAPFSLMSVSRFQELPNAVCAGIFASRIPEGVQLQPFCKDDANAIAAVEGY